MSIIWAFKPLNDSFSVVSFYIFEETYILYYWNHYLMLSWMVFVPTLYMKVPLSYGRIIKYMKY